jgi:gamma-glutamylputrescine oxidase
MPLSIWEKETFYAPQDIIIIGAGLMGLWSALELKNKNEKLRITILERNTTPLGASTRNAGFACFGSPTELLSNAATSGTDSMLEVVEMRYKGIEKIRSHFADAVTGFDHCGGYECINKNYKDWDVLDDKIAWLNASLKEITGEAAIFHRSDDKLDPLGLQHFDCLVENTTEAALHSGKLVRALTQKVQWAGVTILYGMELSGWEKQNDGFSIHTKQNVDLTAHKLLFCTNAFTTGLAEGFAVKPARGQVIVTSPIENLALKGTFHYDEGFYYWRNLGNRILLGGARNTAFEEEETTDLSGSAKVRSALEAFLKEHLHPSCQYTIDHHWSGIMGFTEDKKPFIGYVPGNALVAIACNGMGVALAPMIAEKAAAKLLADF